MEKTSVSLQFMQNKIASTPPSLAFTPEKNLSEWQTAAKAKLEELLGLPLERCEDEYTVTGTTETELYTRTDFTYQSEPGYLVKAALLVPKGISQPLPGVICLQGHSTGMHISFGEAKFPNDSKSIAGGRDFAVQAIKEGFCAVTMEQRYMGSAGNMPDGSPACIGAAANAAMPSLLIGRTAIGERVWDVQRLIDIIEKYFGAYIDSKQLICMGNSGGGTVTFYASCMDERISLSMPSCSVCSYDASIVSFNHCPCNFIPGIRRFFDMGDLGCLIAPRKFILVCGRDDVGFPLAGVKKSFATIESAFKSVGKEQLCRLIIGQGGHRFYPEDAWPVVHQLMNQ